MIKGQILTFDHMFWPVKLDKRAAFRLNLVKFWQIQFKLITVNYLKQTWTASSPLSPSPIPESNLPR